MGATARTPFRRGGSLRERRWIFGDRRGLQGSIGINRERMRGREKPVPLDRKPEASAHAFQLGNPHAAEFRAPEAEIAQPESDVGIFGIKLCQKPGAGSVGREELDDRHKVGPVPALFGKHLADPAVAQQLVVNRFGQEFHHRLLSLRVFSRRGRRKPGASAAGSPPQAGNGQHGPQSGVERAAR
jgi:hypothetical protein